MRIRMVSCILTKVGLFFLIFVGVASATLSPTGVNYEVFLDLISIKNELKDPYNVLGNWDNYSVDPCSWRMITYSPDGYVSALGLPSQSLSGMLSPAIQNLIKLESVLLQNNATAGHIPAEIGKLDKLQTLDLSNNRFTIGIPGSSGDLKNLNYFRLNNNNLTRPCPDSLLKIEGLTPAIICNPLICGTISSTNCSVVWYLLSHFHFTRCS